MLLRAVTVSFLILILGLSSVLRAQNRLWRSVRGKPIVEFDMNCAETPWHPNRKLHSIVQAALNREDTGSPKYADRAFHFDLNGDERPEVFVPLVCGGTGNCTWAVLTTNRPRLIGIVAGEYIYVHRRRGRWPILITYGHLSAVEGSLTTYRFRKDKYVAVADSYAINHWVYDLDIQGGRGHKMPAFLQRARAGCKTLHH